MIPLREIFTIPELELLKRLDEELALAGYHPYSQHVDGYIWAPGAIPVMLVAHVDCVSGHAETVFHDQTHGVYWSPDGLGADDRAGVWGILWLLSNGYRPSILFTDGEEQGGWGARAAADALSRAIASSGVRTLVELDRKGSMEAVYYNCGNADIRKWIESVGFTEDFGTFSDIGILGPVWDIAAVNLSAGYYREHSDAEYLVTHHLMATLGAVQKLLDSPPPAVWPHDTEHELRGFGRRWYDVDYNLYSLHDTQYVNGTESCSLCEREIWSAYNVRVLDGYILCKNCYYELTGDYGAW